MSQGQLVNILCSLKEGKNDFGIYMLDDSFEWEDRVFSRGCRAFTIMLIFGRNSASYCTHNAATAAIYYKIQKQLNEMKSINIFLSNNLCSWQGKIKKVKITYSTFFLKLIKNRIESLQAKCTKASVLEYHCWN